MSYQDDKIVSLVADLIPHIDAKVIDGKVYMDSMTLVRLAGSAVASSMQSLEQTDDIYEAHVASGVLRLSEIIMAVHVGLAQRFASAIVEEASQDGELFPPKE